jgi:protein-tyrosine phosphatase
MTPYTSDNLTGTEKTPSERFARQQYIDIHCHCLPAVDDGPATMTEALALCQRLADDCITTVIATPHQLGRFSDCNESTQIREAVNILNEELKNSNIALTVTPGGDVRVDERICQLLEADKILTLADGGKYILLELPHETFIDIEPLLVELSSLGIQAIISHPERHPFLAKQPKILRKWLEHSAHLQLTSASLLSEFGPIAERAAWDFLISGLASLVATDSHNLGQRRPRMKDAFEHISSKMGQITARLVCIENPLRVLKGRDITSGRTQTTSKYSDETVSSSS